MSTISACPSCRKGFGLFRWRHQCVECFTTRCDDCLRRPPTAEWLSFGEWLPSADFAIWGKLCSGCYQSKVVPFVQKYEAAQAAAKNLQTWSLNYKGHIPRKNEPEQAMVSDWWRERDSAEWQLKVTAAYLGYDLVVELQHEKRTSQEASDNGKGTHYYTEWQARGIGCMTNPGGRGPIKPPG
jgi:hypothetical protein